jgi:uncharacterized protein (TIRG00374 family)
LSRPKLAVGIAVSVALFAYLLLSVDLRQVAAELRRTRWGWTALGVLLAVLGLWVRARRWRYLFPPGWAPPGLVPALMIGYMANNLLPLRAGEVVRVYVVARRWPRGFWTTVATLIVERVLDTLAIVLLLAVLVLVIPVPAVFQWTAVTLLAVDLVAIVALGFLAVAPETCRRGVARLTRRWPSVERRAARIFETFARGLDGIRTWRHLPPLLGWTAIVWLVPALAAWTMLHAVNLDLPWLAGWTVLALVGLGISLPSAPGYVGVFHYAAVLALDIFGVSRPASLGYAIVFHASQVVPTTLVGWVFMLREHLSLREATRSWEPPSPLVG